MYIFPFNLQHELWVAIPNSYESYEISTISNPDQLPNYGLEKPLSWNQPITRNICVAEDSLEHFSR